MSMLVAISVPLTSRFDTTDTETTDIIHTHAYKVGKSRYIRIHIKTESRLYWANRRINLLLRMCHWKSRQIYPWTYFSCQWQIRRSNNNPTTNSLGGRVCRGVLMECVQQTGCSAIYIK